MMKQKYLRIVTIGLLIGSGLVGLRLWASYPQMHISYLHVAMKSSASDMAKVYYDSGEGLSESHSTEVPIIGDQRFHEYRFQIPQGLIGPLRLDPLTGKGSVTIKSMEMVNGYGKKVGSVDLRRLQPSKDIRKWVVRAHEVTVMTVAEAGDPQILIPWTSPGAYGYLSGSFLFFVLRIFLEFVLFSLIGICFGWLWLQRSNWVLRSLLVMALIIFGWRCWSLFEETMVHVLAINLRSSTAGQAKLYYNCGQGFRESDSLTVNIQPDHQYANYRFPLPLSTTYGFRFDPLPTGREGMRIKDVTLMDGLGHRLRTIDLNHLMPENQIERWDIDNRELTFVTETGATDPQIMIPLDTPVMQDWHRSFLTADFIGRMFVEWLVILAITGLVFSASNRYVKSLSLQPDVDLFWDALCLIGSVLLLRIYAKGQWEYTVSFLQRWWF